MISVYGSLAGDGGHARLARSPQNRGVPESKDISPSKREFANEIAPKFSLRGGNVQGKFRRLLRALTLGGRPPVSVGCSRMECAQRRSIVRSHGIVRARKG